MIGNVPCVFCFCVCACFRARDCMYFRVLGCACVFDLNCFLDTLLDTDNREKIFNLFLLPVFDLPSGMRHLAYLFTIRNISLFTILSRQCSR